MTAVFNLSIEISFWLPKLLELLSHGWMLSAFICVVKCVLTALSVRHDCTALYTAVCSVIGNSKAYFQQTRRYLHWETLRPTEQTQCHNWTNYGSISELKMPEMKEQAAKIGTTYCSSCGYAEARQKQRQSRASPIRGCKIPFAVLFNW